MNKNKPLLVEVWGYMKERKAWWLTPIIIMFVIMGILVVVGQSSSILQPFIYALF